MLLFYSLFFYVFPFKSGNNSSTFCSIYTSTPHLPVAGGVVINKGERKSIFLTRSYSSHRPMEINTSGTGRSDKSIPVVKTLQALWGEKAQIVLTKMYELSSGDLRKFLTENTSHLLNSKYLVESEFLLNDIFELKSVEGSVALGA